MKVLYVSKALVVAAYRDKLTALAHHADVTAVVPERWARGPVESPPEGQPAVRLERALLHGHAHFHVYPGADRILEDTRPDLVHIDEEPYSAVTLQWTRLCRRRRIPCLFFAWQNLDKRLPPPFGWVRRRVFRGVNAGIAGTERAATTLRRAGFAGPLAVIPQFGVNERRFRPNGEARLRVRERLGCGRDGFVIGFAGRLVRDKGLHVLVEAVSGLPSAHLIVVGDGPTRSTLEALSASWGASDRIHFAGTVPSLQMPDWLAALDVLVLPSLSGRTWVEQFGRVLIEAMACGVPVVGSDSGEIPNVIGNAGLVVPEGDAGALAAALRSLQSSPDQRRELARMGRERVVASFTHERIAEATADFYRQVLSVSNRSMPDVTEAAR